MTEGAPATLAARYRPDHLRCFGPEEWERFVAPHAASAKRALDGDMRAWEAIAPALAWELLYRVEPELYARLIAGERIHPGVLDWLPEAGTVVEVAAGCGRLTLELASRCDHMVAVEPAAPLRTMLETELERQGIGNVEVAAGFFDDIPAPDGGAGLVVSASAFTSETAHGGEPGLAEMERVVAPGGTIALVWPSDVPWLLRRGFTYLRFPGQMSVDFKDPGSAVEMAGIFYPHAVEEVERRGKARVPYEVLGINPPCDLAFKRLPAIRRVSDVP